MERLAKQYPITQVCEILDCARSTYYHQAAVRDEQELQQAIATVAALWLSTHHYAVAAARMEDQS